MVRASGYNAFLGRSSGFYVIWPEKDSNPLLESVAGEKSGISCSACCLCDLTTDKQKMG